LTILSEPLLASLTTPEFISTGKFIIPLVAFSMIIYGMGQIFGAVVLLSKRSGIFPLVFGAAAAVNLGLNIWLIPRWGIITAAVTTLIAYALATAIMYQQSRKYMKFKLDPVFIIKSVLASGLMVLAIWAFQPVGAPKIVLSVVFGAAIYFVALFLLRGFTKAETDFVIQFFKDTVRLVFRRR
jgi:O-antigen/teichoic acid export membrane protein